MITVKQIDNQADLERAFAIRVKVFVEEQAVPMEDEYDEFDAVAKHYLATYKGEAVGAARWRMTDAGKVKLERFAVLPAFRGKNVGAALVKKVLTDVPKDREIYLHAQVDVIRFYEKLGFVGVGEIFSECDILHQRMKKEGEVKSEE